MSLFNTEIPLSVRVAELREQSKVHHQCEISESEAVKILIGTQEPVQMLGINFVPMKSIEYMGYDVPLGSRIARIPGEFEHTIYLFPDLKHVHENWFDADHGNHWRDFMVTDYGVC